MGEVWQAPVVLGERPRLRCAIFITSKAYQYSLKVGTGPSTHAETVRRPTLSNRMALCQTSRTPRRWQYYQYEIVTDAKTKRFAIIEDELARDASCLEDLGVWRFALGAGARAHARDALRSAAGADVEAARARAVLHVHLPGGDAAQATAVGRELAVGVAGAAAVSRIEPHSSGPPGKLASSRGWPWRSKSTTGFSPSTTSFVPARVKLLSTVSSVVKPHCGVPSGHSDMTGGWAIPFMPSVHPLRETAFAGTISRIRPEG